MSNKKRIRADHRGRFIYRHHFQNGRQKLTKVYLIDGIPSDEIDQHQIYLNNADFFTLLKNGDYEEIHRREMLVNSDDNDKIDDLPF
jgi:hypothetical protein